MRLHDLGMGEYLSNKYALWIDFRMINENTLHGTCRKVGRHGTCRKVGRNGAGITLQIEKKAESK